MVMPFKSSYISYSLMVKSRLYRAIIPCSTDMVSVTKRNFCGRFNQLIFILGAFLTKQKFHPRLFDMR